MNAVGLWIAPIIGLSIILALTLVLKSVVDRQKTKKTIDTMMNRPPRGNEPSSVPSGAESASLANTNQQPRVH
jgi:hypothetical protein